MTCLIRLAAYKSYNIIVTAVRENLSFDMMIGCTNKINDDYHKIYQPSL